MFYVTYYKISSIDTIDSPNKVKAFIFVVMIILQFPVIYENFLHVTYYKISPIDSIDSPNEVKSFSFPFHGFLRCLHSIRRIISKGRSLWEL